VRFIFRALMMLLVLAAVLAGAGWWWLNQPLPLSQPTLELEVEPGTTPRGVAREAVKAGVQTDARLLYAWFRISGQDRQIKAGNYELTTGLTPYVLLQKLARGEESLKALTLVEGWNWRQVRAALAREEFLRQESAGLDDAALMQALGRAGTSPRAASFPIPIPMPRAAPTLPCCAAPCMPWTGAWPMPGRCVRPTRRSRMPMRP
jgi:UPF0755 protein